MQHHALMLAQHRQAQQADIQPPSSDILQLRLRGLLRDLQCNPWVALQVAAQASQQWPGQRHGAGVVQAQAALQAVAHVAGDALGLCQVGQQAAGTLQKGVPRERQTRQACGPLEQRRAQLLLQLLDLPAQRRLGDVQPLGGGAETAALGDFHEVTQLADRRHVMPFRDG
ncbi:hypothetical protein D3C81_1014960 [compost metagenome]